VLLERLGSAVVRGDVAESDVVHSVMPEAMR
jgi:hypothetical protein